MSNKFGHPSRICETTALVINKTVENLEKLIPKALKLLTNADFNKMKDKTKRKVKSK